MAVAGTLTGKQRRGRVLRALVWLLPAALLGLPFLLDDYLQYVVNLMLVYVLVGVGFNIVIGNLGQLAFANAALFGIGAYATGLLMYHLKAPFLLALAAGAVAGGIAGALISLPALRGVRAFYLAIITLAFGELMRWTYINAEPLTLGSMGLHVPRPTAFGIVLVTDKQKFFVFLAVVTALVAMTANLLRSRIGRALMAIRENELAAVSSGVGLPTYKTLAFGVSAFYGGVAGSLYGITINFVNPDTFPISLSILLLTGVVVGGLGSLPGMAIGALFIQFIPTDGPAWLQNALDRVRVDINETAAGVPAVLYGVLLLAVLLTARAGVAGLLRRGGAPLTNRIYHRPIRRQATPSRREA